MENIEGQWTGIITLGKEYRERENEKMLFDLSLVQNESKISGSALDIAGSCINPDAAKFVGSYKENKIKFIKQYPSCHFLKDGKIIVDQSKVGPEIFYTGVYNEAIQAFTGKWVMKNKITVFWIFYIIYKSRGLWKMHKK